MTFIGPSQREQTMTSTANTRLSRAAQSRRYADRVGDGFGGGAGDGVVTDDGADGAGSVRGHCVGGLSTGGGGNNFARRRQVGAHTPCSVDAAPPDGAAGA